MIKAVLFDMDGTLVNSEKYYIDGTYKWIKRCGFNGDKKEVSKIIGIKMDETYEILAKMANITIEEAERLNTEYFEKEDPIDYRNYQFEDTIPTLKKLKELGIKIGICSMSDDSYIKRCIFQLCLEDYIDYYIGGEGIVNTKPNPEIWYKALDTLKLNKDEVIIVEDSPRGIASGINAGIYTCARKDKQFGLDQSSANCLLDSLEDVVKLVRDKI